VFRWIKWLALFLVIASLGLAIWRMIGVKTADVSQQQLPVASINAEQFQYTEMKAGKVIYRLSGVKMHDETGKLGAMRVAVMRVIKIEQVQLELLQPNVSGWVLTADHGELLAGNHQLSLRGHVRGKRNQNETLRAGSVLVNPQQGVIKLQDGFVLDVGNQHRRGIAMELGHES